MYIYTVTYAYDKNSHVNRMQLEIYKNNNKTKE